MAKWEHFSHSADIGVRGFSQSVAQAFEQTALALSAVVADVSAIFPNESVEIHAPYELAWAFCDLRHI